MYILRTSEAQLKRAKAIAEVNWSIAGILMLLFLVKGADWTYAEDSCINEVARKVVTRYRYWPILYMKCNEVRLNAWLLL